MVKPVKPHIVVVAGLKNAIRRARQPKTNLVSRLGLLGAAHVSVSNVIGRAFAWRGLRAWPFFQRRQ